MKESQEEHSLYNSGYWDIFWKNFLVGFARGIGGLAVQGVFLIILYYSFVTIVLPKIQPFLDAFISAQQSVSRLQNSTGSFFNGMFQNDSDTIDLDTPRQTR